MSYHFKFFLRNDREKYDAKEREDRLFQKRDVKDQRYK